MRDITIRAVLNGFIVAVGCQSVVFESREHLLAELRAYLSDPSGTEARYMESDHAKALGLPSAFESLTSRGQRAGLPGGETETPFHLSSERQEPTRQEPTQEPTSGRPR